MCFLVTRVQRSMEKHCCAVYRLCTVHCKSLFEIFILTMARGQSEVIKNVVDVVVVVNVVVLVVVVVVDVVVVVLFYEFSSFFFGGGG